MKPTQACNMKETRSVGESSKSSIKNSNRAARVLQITRIFKINSLDLNFSKKKFNKINNKSQKYRILI